MQGMPRDTRDYITDILMGNTRQDVIISDNERELKLAVIVTYRLSVFLFFSLKNHV